MKKEALTYVIFCIFCEIVKIPFFTEHPWTTASGDYHWNSETYNALPVFTKALWLVLIDAGYNKNSLTFFCPLVVVAKGLLIIQKTLK